MELWQKSVFFPLVVRVRRRVFSPGAYFRFFLRSDKVLVYDNGSVTIIGGSCHKYHFWSWHMLVMTNTCLLRQNMSFVFVTTNICHDKHNFDFCCLKLIFVFVVTKHIFCHDKSMLVVLSQQKFYHDKKYDQHNFVTTKDLLRQAYFCCDNRCV